MHEIIIKKELRPCFVDGRKALFHCWENRSEVLIPSIMRGGHSGVVSGIIGIVEHEDGTIYKALPEKIRFADTEFEEYCFNERRKED